MKAVIYAAAAAALTISLSGCATVTRGTTVEFKVESNPSGAAVRTSTGFTCPATPCSIKIPRKSGFDVTVSKTGFKSVTVHVTAERSGGGTAGMAGNVLLGGFVGMAVDGTNGSMNDLKPNPLVVTLTPETAAPGAR